MFLLYGELEKEEKMINMKREEFKKWYPLPNVAPMYLLEEISHIDGLTITLKRTKGYDNQGSAECIEVNFPHFVTYTNTDESYAEGFWIDKHGDAFSFYKTENSTYIDFFRKTSVLFDETLQTPVHYVFVAVDSVTHVISDSEPIVREVE